MRAGEVQRAGVGRAMWIPKTHLVRAEIKRKTAHGPRTQCIRMILLSILRLLGSWVALLGLRNDEERPATELQGPHRLCGKAKRLAWRVL